MIYYTIRVESGWFRLSMLPDIWIPGLIIWFYWTCIFWFFGLYQPWYAKSRFDEFILVFKSVVFGILTLFFLIYFDDTRTGSPSVSRILIFIYSAIIFTFVSSGRVILRTTRRRMLSAGVGLHNTLIVGSHSHAEDLFRNLRLAPALGYRIIAFVHTEDKPLPPDSNFLSEVRLYETLDELETAIRELDIQEIIIALPSREHELLLDIISRCSGSNVGLKIRPDMYDIVSGLARTNQIYGVPLIEIMPEIMKPWEHILKRVLDIASSCALLLIGLPFWFLLALCIKLDSRGPVFYRQQRVGKNGKMFRIFKFRSMSVNAESLSGPTWAGKDDPRVTRAGRYMRKTHLDEIPQFINVLEGHMSLVGPRPERPFFVEKFTKEIPLYRRRLNVRPGITGWAQVKHKYDESLEDVRTKLQYDLFYIENMSFRMDINILIRTLFRVFLAKGHA